MSKTDLMKEGEAMDLLSEATNLRAIYQNMESYQCLREEDRKFFDNLFILLLVYDDKNFSNKYLAQRFNMPISTIEKRIKRLAQAKLIRRCASCEYVESKNHWTTISRTLELDPMTFSFTKIKEQSERIKTAKIEAIVAMSKEIEAAHPELKTLSKTAPPDEPPPKYKVEVRFE